MLGYARAWSMTQGFGIIRFVNINIEFLLPLENGWNTSSSAVR
jgi:hypothetical protein